MVYYRSKFRNHNRNRHPHRKCNSVSRQPRYYARIGTLNVRQWNPIAERTTEVQRTKGKAVAEWMRQARLDVLLCTELYWRAEDNNRRTKRPQAIDEFILFPSGQVAIMVHKAWAGRIQHIKRFGERNMCAKIGGVGVCVTYRPHAAAGGHEEYETERSKTLDYVEKRGWPPLMGGDWNAAIGGNNAAWGENNVDKPPSLGQFCIGECSNAGMAVAEWAQTRSMKIIDSFVPIHRRATYKSPFYTWVELDYFCASARVRIMRTECRTSCVQTDHRCKIVNVRIAKSKKEKKAERAQRKIAAMTSSRYDFEKLRSLEHEGPKCRRKWAEATDAFIEQQDAIEGETDQEWIERTWTNLHSSMVKAGDEILGRRVGRVHDCWEDPGIIREMHKKTRRLLKKLGDARTREERVMCQLELNAHRKENKEARDEMFETFLKHHTDRAVTEFQNLEGKTNIAGKRQKDVKLAYRSFKNLNDRVEGTLSSENASPFTTEAARKHFSKIGSEEAPWDARFENELQQWTPRKQTTWYLEAQPTREEIMETALKMKESATGTDAIHVTMIRHAGPRWLSLFHRLVKKIWTTGWFPDVWRLVKFSPLYKGAKAGLKSDLNAYRAVALVQVPARLVSKMWSARIYRYVENSNLLPETQMGFREQVGTTEALLCLRTLMEQSQKYDTAEEFEICLLSHDIRKAFPTVCRRRARMALEHIGLPPRMVALYEAIHSSAVYFVDVGGQASETFKLKRGHKEGDPSSPLMYTILSSAILASLRRRARGVNLRYDSAYQDAVRKQNKGRKAAQRVDNISHIAFADDTTGVCHRRDMAAEEANFTEVLEIFGFQENEGKKESVGTQPRREEQRQMFTHEKESIRILGGRLARRGDYAAEDAIRIAQANAAWAKWRPRLRRCRNLRPYEVGNILKQNVLSCLAQDSFARPWTQASLKRMETVWGRIMREAAGWNLPAMRGKANMADLRIHMCLPTFSAWVEGLRANWLEKVLWPPSNKQRVWRKFVFGCPQHLGTKFRKGMQNVRSIRHEMADTLTALCGRKYMEVVLNGGPGQWQQLWEDRWNKLATEDWKKSYAGEKEWYVLDAERKAERRDLRVHLRDNYHTMTIEAMVTGFQRTLTLGSSRRRILEELGESGAPGEEHRNIPGLRDTIPTVRTDRQIRNTLWRERNAQ